MKFKRLVIDGSLGAPLAAMESPGDYELHLYDYEGVCSSLSSISIADRDIRNEFLIAKTLLETYARDKNVRLQ